MESVPAPRVRPTLPRVLSDAEFDNILDAAQSKRDLALVALPLDNGVRLGEIAALRYQDVRETTITVDGKVGQRVVPVSEQVRDLLLSLGDGEYVWFGRRGPMTHSGIQLAIRRVMSRAGIIPPKSGPHLLRHTFAVRYLMNGGDVFSLQRIMGHSSVQSTMIYVHMSAWHLSRQHRQFSPLVGVRLQSGC